ncbi:MAG: TIM barrel protein [Clostridia bacterium]|nr:TIM barrel protein [Clostridia bacterium]
MIRFGPEGNAQAFYEEGYKSSLEMPEWLSKLGLNAYEYPCTRGVRLSEKMAKTLGAKAKERDITLSVHAPYYINLATDDEDKRKKSIDYIMQTLQAAQWMEAQRIVVHSGACAKMTREEAMGWAEKTLRMAIQEADAAGFGEIHICPETMGKINQLGTLDEVLQLCRLDDRLLPTIDFGHLHTRGLGCLNTKEDFAAVLDAVENKLGKERAKRFHSHFSRIEYTKGGEKRHWCFRDNQFGPDFDPLAELLAQRNLEPVILCESAGTQAEDALEMKQKYEACMRNR